MPETATGGPQREFHPTRWTLILASRDNPEARRAALERVLEDSWKPLYFFARRKGRSIESSKDAVQGFALHLLERDFLTRLDPGRGRLRSYLKSAFEHFLVNLHESDSALKRGGGAKTVALDFEVAERHLGSHPDAADAAFDREWALGILGRSMDRLRAEFASGERDGPVELALEFFRPDGPPPTYADAAARAGMSESAFKAFLHRARVRFRELAREEVRHTCAEPGETDDELASLLEVLAG